MIDVDKGISVPSILAVKGKYPWSLMDIGDSFFIEGKAPKDISGPRANAERKTGAKFISRKVQGGVRIWRAS